MLIFKKKYSSNTLKVQNCDFLIRLNLISNKPDNLKRHM